MKLLAPLVAAGAASAHTIFTSLEVGGVNHGTGNGVRVPSYNGPIENVLSDSIACNGNPNPTQSTSKVITVQAGQDVTAIWRYMLSTTGSAPNDIMDSSHKGPTLAYLKKVNDATSDSGIGGGWFKIQEDGFTNGVWGTEKVINGKGRHTIRIPQCIAPGQYLRPLSPADWGLPVFENFTSPSTVLGLGLGLGLIWGFLTVRAEMIALHGAGNYPGAQFYQECAQINVVGGTGSKTPSSTVSFPGAYSGSDPGVKLSIYWPPVTNYKVPGPPVFTC
ncbi:glycosyl hydrolase family 61-domain-containing protein [Schizothecium vesticola]|uniref:lytic cellulose monooxygenase (C4-dehydrogenating) n=1 Tax=Schizothecium vesticola TaxID=314040 RepID=A0AA40KAU6_9PEZI|nr:glycosyl hydrolase family 61-domain-containing protein [Schizothecium vesticola]